MERKERKDQEIGKELERIGGKVEGNGRKPWTGKKGKEDNNCRLIFSRIIFE